MIALRPYQRAAIDATFAWMANNDGNPLIVLPTGAGKSLVLSAILHDVLTQWPNERIVCATHVKELIEQNHIAALRYWPECPAGVHSAGLRRRDIEDRVLFCGIQSVYDKAKKLGWVDLVIVDEAHLIPRSGDGRYRRLFADLKSMNGQLRVIGLTATPFRTDSGYLHKGDDRFFDGVSYDADLVQLIRDGWLSKTTAKATETTIEVEGVKKTAGEFNLAALEVAAMGSDAVPAAVEEIVRRGRDRKAWLVFCVGVRHAVAVAEQLKMHGIDCAQIYGSTPPEDRAEIVRAFKSRELRCIVNVNVLTTGFDAPHVDLIAILRPTCSPGLFVQMAGRGFRLAEGKTDCLLLDFGGNFDRHGPLDDISPSEADDGGGDGESPVKTCPSCEEIIHAALKECPVCGHMFEKIMVALHAAKPAEVEAIRGLEPVKFDELRIIGTQYLRHQKTGKPHPVLRVSYLASNEDGNMTQQISEWVCLEHEGYARSKAIEWWRKHLGASPAPSTVAEALQRQHELGEPVALTLKSGGGKEWPEVVAVECRGKVEPGSDEPDAGPPASFGVPINYNDIPF
jgi:DNA repair protein RadD